MAAPHIRPYRTGTVDCRWHLRFRAVVHGSAHVSPSGAATQVALGIEESRVVAHGSSFGKAMDLLFDALIIHPYAFNCDWAILSCNSSDYFFISQLDVDYII